MNNLIESKRPYPVLQQWTCQRGGSRTTTGRQGRTAYSLRRTGCTCCRGTSPSSGSCCWIEGCGTLRQDMVLVQTAFPDTDLPDSELPDFLELVKALL
jgi:hypothetical protein